MVAPLLCFACQQVPFHDAPEETESTQDTGASGEETDATTGASPIPDLPPVICGDGEVDETEECEPETPEDLYCRQDCVSFLSLIWEQIYDHPDQGGFSSDDIIWDVVVDSAGDIFATGTVSSGATGFPLWVARHGEDGEQLWTYTSAARATLGGGKDIDFLPNGDVVAVGAGDFANTDLLVVRLEPDLGAVVWERNFNGPESGGDLGWALDVLGDGRIAVSGSEIQGDGRVGVLRVLDDAGMEVWSARSGADGLDTELYAVAEDGMGRIVVAGATGEWMWLEAFDGDGVSLLTQFGPDGRLGRIDALSRGPDGNLVGGGLSKAVNPGAAWIFRLDDLANVAWEWKHDKDSGVRDLAVGDDGSIRVAGFRFDGTFSHWAAGFDADELWVWDHPNGNTRGAIETIAIDGETVVMAGWDGHGFATDDDQYLARFEDRG
jgi:hypothetical protein